MNLAVVVRFFRELVGMFLYVLVAEATIRGMQEYEHGLQWPKCSPVAVLFVQHSSVPRKLAVQLVSIRSAGFQTGSLLAYR